MEQVFDVSSICNVLVDILLEVSDEDLKTFALEKGKMHLVSKGEQRKILDTFEDHFEKIELGGSSLNTIKALAQLGCKVSFSGMLGDDHYGKIARKAMNDLGMKSHLQEHSLEETGKSLILVTPDGERTMNTCLGASSLYEESSALLDGVKKSRFFHFSGYQWNSPEQKQIALKSIELTKEKGGLVSFDLADPFVVREHRDDFLELLDKKVDIFFGNREETTLLFGGLSLESFLNKTKNTSITAVIKLDKKGAFIHHHGEKIAVPPLPTKVVDTTGAGDMFAAGFLCGMVHGLDLGVCGKIASLLASDVISHFGATLSEDSLRLAMKEVKKAKKL